ncbi:uncharacterized protein LOC115629093 isoform X2 [Scaptodrosophila lebanonensis]|uniref:Uncharacterized protein LOC115629093 isoform X2 n=1 Tax=Drosophila lebanonensis TaxID=7225 RepID=A0A6J2U1D7_DROLE|nr:uncharacterized protein LOC115629093 isoform X2 [Scaptodrosophila lebanonensis]
MTFERLSDATIEAKSVTSQLISVDAYLRVATFIISTCSCWSSPSPVYFSKVFKLSFANLSLHKQSPFKLLTVLLLLLVTTCFKSDLYHMLGNFLIKRQTVAITYDLSAPAKKGAPPIQQKRSKGFELCMNLKRRIIGHRTSSNRHRKLQPFRYT